MPNFTIQGCLERVYNKLPTWNMSEKAQGRAAKIDKVISTPEQRLVQGVSALMTQPFIDLNNDRVDEDTRLASVARTLGKIIAGTTVGVIVRHLSIKSMDKLVKEGGFFNINAVNKATTLQKEQYKKVVGSSLGVIVGLFTNFILDAPITIFLTNRFLSYFKGKKQEPKTYYPPPHFVVPSFSSKEGINGKI